MTHKISAASLIQDWESGICLRPLATKYGMSPATAKKYLNDAGIDTAKKACFSKDVWNKIQAINLILNEYDTRLTVRQAYYQCASRGIVPLTTPGYRSIQSAISKGRKYGYVPWDKIEDRTRQPHTPIMFGGLEDYKEAILQAYRRDIWQNQPRRFEVWLEKNALFGVINPITQYYGITLQTITGYSSISAIHDGANRLKDGDTILYLGDHDATGIDIDRSLRDGFLEDHGKKINIERIGLIYEDIEKYNLLSNPEKEEDPRTKEYPYEKQAELDALPPDVLRDRIEAAIISHLDMGAYNECKIQQEIELNMIRTRLGNVQFGGAE